MNQPRQATVSALPHVRWYLRRDFYAPAPFDTVTLRPYDAEAAEELLKYFFKALDIPPPSANTSPDAASSRRLRGAFRLVIKGWQDRNDYDEFRKIDADIKAPQTWREILRAYRHDRRQF